MKIEQSPPNKPNFLLVLVLAGVSLLLLLVLAYFFIDFEGGHIHFRHRHANPNALLLAPAFPRPPAKKVVMFTERTIKQPLMGRLPC